MFGWVPGMVLALLLWAIFGLMLGWLLPGVLGWRGAVMVALGVLLAWTPLGAAIIGLWTLG